MSEQDVIINIAVFAANCYVIYDALQIYHKLKIREKKVRLMYIGGYFFFTLGLFALWGWYNFLIDENPAYSLDTMITAFLSLGILVPISGYFCNKAKILNADYYHSRYDYPLPPDYGRWISSVLESGKNDQF